MEREGVVAVTEGCDEGERTGRCLPFIAAEREVKTWVNE
jgi:hypothetical protein